MKCLIVKILLLLTKPKIECGLRLHCCNTSSLKIFTMKNKLRSIQKNSDIKPLLKTAGFIVNEKQLAIDLQMVSYDLWGTLAHVLMLYKQQIISKKHIKPILSALLEIKEE